MTKKQKSMNYLEELNRSDELFKLHRKREIDKDLVKKCRYLMNNKCYFITKDVIKYIKNNYTEMTTYSEFWHSLLSNIENDTNYSNIEKFKAYCKMIRLAVNSEYDSEYGVEEVFFAIQNIILSYYIGLVFEEFIVFSLSKKYRIITSELLDNEFKIDLVAEDGEGVSIGLQLKSISYKYVDTDLKNFHNNVHQKAIAETVVDDVQILYHNQNAELVIKNKAINDSEDVLKEVDKMFVDTKNFALLEELSLLFDN